MTDAQAALAQVREAYQRARILLGEAGVNMTVKQAERILAHVETQAAEIERLTAALQHEADCVEAAKEEIERLTAECADLRRQLAEAEMDAERYRWLRGREDGRYMTVYAFRTDVDEVCLGEELDATIDAARREK